MSAVFGIYHPHGPDVARDLLASMAAPVRRRGPDGSALHEEGPLGFGHVDLDTGDVTPMASIGHVGHLLVVAAARIDNRPDLAASLELEADATSADLIARAHLRWKADAPAHLIGAFAYAMWDRSERCLTLVRDPLGVRPLYVARMPEFTAFATDCRSLLVLPGVAREHDEVGIFHLFFPDLLAEDQETTAYAAIKRLPPAHVLELIPSGERPSRRYWSLDPQRELSLASDGEYVEAFREHFDTAVRRCLPDRGPVGATLSGGLDSSSITAVAANALEAAGREPLHTFSAVFPSAPGSDESRFSRAVAAMAPVIAHEFAPAENSLVEDLPELLAGTAYPIPAPNLFIYTGAGREARAAGVRVLLEGLDGDTTVGHGYDVLIEAANDHRWRDFAREAVALSRRYDTRGGATRHVMTTRFALPELRALAATHDWPALLAGIHQLGRGLGSSRKALLAGAWRGRHGNAVPAPDLSHLDQDFLRRVDGPARLADLAARRTRRQTTRRGWHARALNSGMLTVGLETLEPIGARFGLEFRHPFCDRDLVEFCLAIPASLQLREGWIRWILCQAMAPLLPDEVCWRGGKANLASIHRQALIAHDREHVQQRLARVNPVTSKFVSSGFIERVRDDFFLRGNEESSGPLWQLLALDVWLEFPHEFKNTS